MSVFAKAVLRVYLSACVHVNAACCASPNSGVEFTANQSKESFLVIVVISYNYIFVTDLIIIL